MDVLNQQPCGHTLLNDGFIQNKYELCCYNKQCSDNIQLTVIIHVDDLLITCIEQVYIDYLISTLTLKYVMLSTLTY
jgi:hypothetical protein